MIEVRHLVKRFGPRTAVDEVSFDVRRGDVLGFLGPNGAGKTTTMRMIAGFLPADRGSIRVCDFDIAQRPIPARERIGYLPENAPSYDDMTVEAFLGFLAGARGFRGAERRQRVEAALERCLLQPVRRQTIDTLSKGYRQRTGFAQAILHDPPVLILDEPTEGLDPNQKQVVRDMIRRMGREKAIVLSTHILEEVEAICTRIVIISAGRLAADGTPEELKARDPIHRGVELTLAGPVAGAMDALRRLAPVRDVEVLDEGRDGRTRVRALPRGDAPLLETLLRESRDRGWDLRGIRPVEGRLDVVFRSLTRTADVGDAARREAA